MHSRRIARTGAGLYRPFALPLLLSAALLTAAPAVALDRAAAPAAQTRAGGTAASGRPAMGSRVAPVSGADPVADCRQPGQPGAVQPGTHLGGNVAVSRDGTHSLGVYLQDAWSDGGARAVVAVSAAGNGSARTDLVPITECAAAGSPPERANNAWVSLGPDQRAYVAVQTSRRTTPGSGITVAVSGPALGRWHGAALATETGSRFSVQFPTVSADPVQPGVAYAVWSRYDTGADGTGLSASVMLSQTHDGGVTWSPPRTIVPAGALQVGVGATVVADARRHALYCFLNLVSFTAGNVPAPDRGWFSVSTSHDGGGTWTSPGHVAEDTNAFYDADPNTGQLIRAADGLFTAAVDERDGTLYVAYEAGDYTKSAYDQAQLVRSRDGGSTWSVPLAVSGADAGPGLTPTVAVAEDGTVGILYQSFTDLLPGDTTTLPTTVWLALSHDRGGTFSRVRVGRDFDLLTAPMVLGAPTVGLRQGLAAGRHGFRVQYVAADGSRGAPSSQVLAGWIS